MEELEGISGDGAGPDHAQTRRKDHLKTAEINEGK
jgi:hypothetical protein